MLKNLLITTCALCLLTACGGGAGGGSRYAGGKDVGILKIGKPYEVEGRTYTPAYTPDYQETGVASWYGPGFHGRATANGEKFDQHTMTAAHRTLPMPSVVEVMNLENGRSTTVVVNDRGPFRKDRIIDLSQAAAKKLGVIEKGTAPVRVTYLPEQSRKLINERIASGNLKADEKTLAMLEIDRANSGILPPSPAADYALVSSAEAMEPPVFSSRRTTSVVTDNAPVAPVITQDLAAPEGVKVAKTELVTVTPPGGPSTRYMEKTLTSGQFVQAGSFSREQNAHELAQKLAPLGQTSVKPVDVSGRTWYRVRLGPLADAAKASMALAAVRDMGIADARIIQE